MAEFEIKDMGMLCGSAEATVRELKQDNAKLRPLVQMLANLPEGRGLTETEVDNLRYAAIQTLAKPEVAS